MAKLKTIIKQLSVRDYEAIYDSLSETSAKKTTHLLFIMRENQFSHQKMIEELNVNSNAYYTLRSRLNYKITEYLLQQTENPRTNILKNIAYINEIIFTKKPAIAIAALKKLEKKLLNYKLSSELTIVYKSLKKLHINTQYHFRYSQLYNKHIAYMLTIDKTEDFLSQYFKKYGEYFLSGEKSGKTELSLIAKEVASISTAYPSHKLYIYHSCTAIFHQLFVEAEQGNHQQSIKNTLEQVQKIFKSYPLDSIYYHLQILFEFLRFEYYNHYQLYTKAEKIYHAINNNIESLLSSYSSYTYPAQFLITKIHRAIRLNTQHELYEDNKVVFQYFQSDILDIPKHINYVLYRAISCYYVEKHNEAAKWINNLLNQVSLKKYPIAQLEIKVVLVLQYCLLNDHDLFKQIMSSIQRQIRLIGKEKCKHLVIFTKMLKVSLSHVKESKVKKINALANKFNQIKILRTAPTNLIKIDSVLIHKLNK